MTCARAWGICGPDASGKSTLIRELVARGWTSLGAVHDHDPEPWERAAHTPGGYSKWWFEAVPYTELARMFQVSGCARLNGTPGGTHRVALDRGGLMHAAVCAATAAATGQRPLEGALNDCLEILGPILESEWDILLKLGDSPDESIRRALSRRADTWSQTYLEYQRQLWEALDLLEHRGAFIGVFDVSASSSREIAAQIDLMQKNRMVGASNGP